MVLHNHQSSLNLPSLKIDKKDDRQSIEDDSAVKNLINSNLLLDKELNHLFVKFLGITKEINKLLERKDDYNRLSFMMGSRHRPDYRVLEWQLIRKLKKGTREQRQELEKELKIRIQEERRKLNQNLKNKIKKLSNQLQSELDSFEGKKNIKLNIFESLNLHLCKTCKKILCLDRFHTIKCDCGKNISNPSDCEIITVHKLGGKIIQFIEDNMWLEHGIDYLLRKKSFNTICGIYILGYSGIGHEIDNVAEMKSDNLRIFCECKNKDIIVKDIFVFAGKMADIGCTRGYIFTTSFETSKDVKQLARSKNITIIEQVLEKDDKALIKEIKEGS